MFLGPSKEKLNAKDVMILSWPPYVSAFEETKR
jgi:hypothetical protein